MSPMRTLPLSFAVTGVVRTAGKLGLILNLKQPEGLAVARDLIGWADVVIESFSPGQMERWGLDYESVRPLNPSVIMLSTSLMGQTGPAARLAKDCITKVEVLEYPELGMEAVWKIEVVDFPAFIVVDDKGNDFFSEVSKPVALR